MTKSTKGRPAVKTPKAVTISLRLTDTDANEIRRAAEADHRSVSDWLRLAALKAARSR